MPTTNAFPTKKLILWGGDIFLILISFYLARVLRFGYMSGSSSVFTNFEIVAIVLYLIFFYIFDLHNIRSRVDNSTFVRMGLAIAIVNIPLTSVLYIFNVRPYGAGLFLLSACLVYLLTYGWRVALDRIVPPEPPTRVVILGAGMAGRFVQSALIENTAYRTIGFLDDDPRKKGLQIGNADVMGSSELLDQLVRDRSVDLVILAISHFVNPDTYKNLSETKMSGIAVSDFLSFSEMALGKVPIYHINDSWLISEPILSMRKTVYNEKAKMIIDRLLALIGLVITVPLIFLIALFIKIDSAGPIIYKQQRVGKDGRQFTLYKFRSMRQNAEANGAIWARQNDPRITRVGSFLRRFRLDEIPQLWNVLRGEMSLVGPRPERPEFVKDLINEIPYFSLRHSVRPGITGWAQVNYPYGASKEDAIEKLQYDIYYIKNLSPLLDFVILARTLRIVIFGKGAR